MPDSGLLTPQSAIGFATLEILAERHVGIFAGVDHAEGAAAAGLARDQPRSRYSAFPCNSRCCAASISGVPPPADEGAGLARCGWNRQNSSYNARAWIAARHGMSGTTDRALASLTAAIDAFARYATG